MKDKGEINKKNQLVILFNCESRANSIMDFALFDEIYRNIHEDNDLTINQLEDQFGIICIETALMTENEDVIEDVERKIAKKDLVSGENKINSYQSLTFYFRTILTPNNADSFTTDILMPFVLIRKKHSYKKNSKQPDNINFILYIYNQAEEKYYYKFSHDMIVESLINQPHWRKSNFIDKDTNRMVHRVEVNNPPYNQCFFLKNRDGELKPQRLQVNDIGYLHKRIPWLILSAEAYGVLSENVEDLFPTFDSLKQGGLDFWNDLESQLGDLVGKNFSTEEQKKSYREILIRTSIKRTCQGMIPKKEENDFLRELHEYCKSLSLLSFLFLLAFLGAPFLVENLISGQSVQNEPKEKPSLKELMLLIKNSQDIASGVLQLIENAVEYAEENAILWFRVLDTEKIQKDYGEKLLDIDKYLEIRIIDYNDKTIPETFQYNLKHRHQKGYFEDFELTIADFFQPGPKAKKKWESFYRDIKNINHHFGLNHFLSTIKYGKGYFRVVSSQQISPKDTEIFNWPNLQTINEGQVKIRNHIPGSEYTILLPLLQSESIGEQVTSGTGVIPDFSDEILNREVCYIDFLRTADELHLLDGPFSQQIKVDKVSALANKLQGIVKKYISHSGSLPVLCFYFDHDNPLSVDRQYIVDIFTKSILEYIHLKSSSIKHRIAIVNASRPFVINFTIGFATYCQKTDGIPAIKERVKDTQIYICDKSPDLELYFVNGELATTYKSNEFFFSKKGISPEPHNLIRVLLETAMLISPGKQYKVAPFDLICKASPVSPMTLFERSSKLELERDVQQPSFGCTLNNAHVRVGSKIHLTEKFFDATLLLASDYYTSRFAYLLAVRINDSLGNPNQNVTLIAYENYSEFLVAEIKHILKEYFHYANVNYVIYQEDLLNKFKYPDQIKSNQNFFIIVPINSTLSTHDKITAALSNYISNQDQIQDNSIVTNFALILIRDSNPKEENLTIVEKKYWKEIDLENRVVKTRFREKLNKNNPKNPNDQNLELIPNEEVKAYYNILLESSWQDPLKCCSCFPPSVMLTDEKPMLEVAKTSVMSMALAGLQKTNNISDRFNIQPALGDIKDLKNYLIYQHLEDGGNHYLFYFKTEGIIQELIRNSNTNYIKWKEQIKGAINKEQEENKRKNFIVYDVIVAPLNSTNGAFIQDLITDVFDNLTFVIYIDPSREFRENIKAKFSHLTSLYNNNRKLKRKSIINFHYINDTITSGNTIRRTQSLLKSLFPLKIFKQNRNYETENTSKNSDSNYVNIFSNVIILLNRCSVSTRADYISPDHFFRFYDLEISSIRNNRENSCIVCKNQKDFESIASYCSTNELANFWQGNADKIQVHTYQQIEKSKELNPLNSDKIERQFRRLLCAHNFSKEITNKTINNINYPDNIREIQESINNINRPENIRRIILQLIDEEMKILNEYTSLQDAVGSLTHVVEYTISYLKVLTRPFLVFRKSTLEAIFKIVLEFMELFINKIDEKRIEYIPADFQNINKLLNTLLYKEWEWPESNEQMELFKNPSKTDIPLPESSIHVALHEDDKIRIDNLSQDLFKCLLSRLSVLGSKYLIRKDNLIKIRECAREIELTEKGFDLFYLEQIKRLITLNKDESIELWLDILLSTGEEYFALTHQSTKENIQTFSLKDTFYRNLFLENTHIIHDAIRELFQKITENDEHNFEDISVNLVQDNLKHYFFDNFVQLRLLHQQTHGNEAKTLSLNSVTLRKITSLVKLYYLLQKRNDPDKEENKNEHATEEFYESFASYIKNITNCDFVQFAAVMHEMEESPYFLTSIVPIRKIRFSALIEEISREGENSVFWSDDSDLDWIIKFKINGGSKFYIFLVWDNNLDISTHKNGYVNQLYAIRDILAFRNDIIRCIDRDFTNNAYLQYLNQKELFIKLSKIKTATHTPESERLQVCNNITRLCCEDNDDTISQTEKKLAAMNLKLAADSLISELAYKRLNAEFASLENVINTEITNEDLVYTIVDINDRLVSILNEITCKRSEDPSEDSKTKVKIKISENSLRHAISFMLKSEDHYLLLFIVALCQNAVKHGIVEKDDASDSNFVLVEIFIDDNNIHIKNSFSLTNDNPNADSFSSLNEIKNYYDLNFVDQKSIIQPATFKYGIDNTKNYFVVELPLINIRR